MTASAISKELFSFSLFCYR